MYLESLDLSHYRNYDQVQATFSKGINIFIGENAQGKTNLLEAIYVLAMTRSHRTNNDQELISWNEEFARLAGVVQKKATHFPLELTISSKGKKAKINHLEQAKLSQYIGQFNVILFAPEDLSLVKGAPALRRKFIDMEFGQMSPKYLYHLGQYKQLLKQRNQYLKQLAYKKTKDRLFLEVLSEQLAANGAEVMYLRYHFLKKLEKWAQAIHHGISNGLEALTFEYVCQIEMTDETTVDELFEALTAKYQTLQDKEVEQGITLAGLHREDVRFYVNGQNVQTFGSQGQQRTTALSIKLAEIDLMKQETGEYPVLLLDDVLSELDDNRQTHLLKAIQDKVQTFITTTNLSGISQKVIQSPRVFEVQQGQLKMGV